MRKYPIQHFHLNNEVNNLKQFFNGLQKFNGLNSFYT